MLQCVCVCVLLGVVGNNGRASSGGVRDHWRKRSVPCGRQLRDTDSTHVHVRTEPLHAGAGQDTSPQLSGPIHGLNAACSCRMCFQCFDAVGWATGRASSL